MSLEGLFGVEDNSQAGDKSLDIAQTPFVDGRAQLVGQGRAGRPQGLLHGRRPGHSFAGTKASPFGDRVRQGKVGRQQVENPAQPLVIAGTKTHHGLAKQTPSRKRGAPPDSSEQDDGPLPVPSIHSFETRFDLPGVSP